MTAKRKHAITPSDRGPRPDRHGIYPAATWRQSNPHYETGTPRVSGKWAEVDGGIVYDASRLGVK